MFSIEASKPDSGASLSFYFQQRCKRSVLVHSLLLDFCVSGTSDIAERGFCICRAAWRELLGPALDPCSEISFVSQLRILDHNAIGRGMGPLDCGMDRDFRLVLRRTRLMLDEEIARNLCLLNSFRLGSIVAEGEETFPNRVSDAGL